MNNETKFPGRSKKRINKAGENFKMGIETDEDHQIFDDWRSAHRFVLNSFQAMLRTKVKNKQIIFAQRHKRKKTIIDKLKRIDGMKLSRMDDVAGCRLIFKDITSLNEFRDGFHKSSFDHTLRNENDKYNYIKMPKKTGYRGIHDIYIYNVRSERREELSGLQIEIQYRTLVQHYWATTNEIIGFITESQPKFERGDIRYQIAMQYASEILARVYEKCTGPMQDIDNITLVNKFDEINKELGLLNILKRLNTFNTNVTTKKNTILIYKDNEELQLRSYRDSGDAIKALFRLEKEFPGYDIVLVKADKNEDIKMSFKNYFTDAKDFIRMIEEGTNILKKKSRQ